MQHLHHLMTWRLRCTVLIHSNSSKHATSTQICWTDLRIKPHSAQIALDMAASHGMNWTDASQCKMAAELLGTCYISCNTLLCRCYTGTYNSPDAVILWEKFLLKKILPWLCSKTTSRTNPKHRSVWRFNFIACILFIYLFIREHSFTVELWLLKAYSSVWIFIGTVGYCGIVTEFQDKLIMKTSPKI